MVQDGGVGDCSTESPNASAHHLSAQPPIPALHSVSASEASYPLGKNKKSDNVSLCESTWRKTMSLFRERVMRLIHFVAKFSPLLAAIAAPLSTLLDIPALAQDWYLRDGKPVPDRRECVALSSTSLALNIVAMILLLLRFSSFQGIWQRAANLSVIFWFLKTLVALCNVFIFGLPQARPPGAEYSEGFWSAVMSVIIAGSITVALFLHLLLTCFKPFDAGDSQDLRLTGRKFLVSVTGFTIIIGLEALAFSQLENWRYLDAIYFSIQTALTVGYGDLTVQTAAGKVLTFIFAALTLCQLGNVVSITIDWVQARAVERRQKWLKKYSLAVHRSAVKRKPHATLIDEIALLHQINVHQESLIQLWDLIWALASLFSFWCLGAMTFHYIEGWGYGNALYSVMVMSFTIGYGDYTPVTAAGRVTWIVYALLAVPVVTNFATQTVTGILYTLTEHQFTNDLLAIERDKDPEVFAPHSHFVLRHHRRWEKVRRMYLDTLKEAEDADDAELEEDFSDDDSRSDSGPLDEKLNNEQREFLEDGLPPSVKPEHEDHMVDNVLKDNKHPAAVQAVIGNAVKSAIAEKQVEQTSSGSQTYDEKQWMKEPLRREQIEFYLLKQLIGRVTRLEAQARQMLIDTMDKDLAQTLLVADRNLQIRDAFQLYGNDNDSSLDLADQRDDEHNRSSAAKAEHLRQLEQETNLVSGDTFDDDMLTRVRRYRSTFAEILVLSSTLLGLEGDDLKRFERWHIQLEGGSYKKYHHQRFTERVTKKRRRRKRLQRKLHKRGIDTDGKVRPPGIPAPGDRVPPDHLGAPPASRSGSSSTPPPSVSPPRPLQPRRSRSPSSHLAQATTSAENSASADADSLLASENASIDTSYTHSSTSSAPKEQHKLKHRIWGAMEDELFRRTDKNVEHIISSIPEEEEQEYLTKEAFARELLLTSEDRKREEEDRLKDLEREANNGQRARADRRGERAAAQEGSGSGGANPPTDPNDPAEIPPPTRPHRPKDKRKADLYRQARAKLDDVWNTMNAGPDNMRPYTVSVEDKPRRGHHRPRHHSHRDHRRQHQQPEANGYSDQASVASDASRPRQTVYAVPADGREVYQRDPSDPSDPCVPDEDVRFSGGPIPPLKMKPMSGGNVV